MIVIGGYTIRQVTNKNRIVITLPQTWENISDTVTPVSDRKQSLTPEEEAGLLYAAIMMFERGEKHDKDRT